MGLLDDVAAELTKRTQQNRGVTLPSEQFVQLRPSVGRGVFIDGGSGTLLSTPTSAVAFIRVCGVLYEGRKRSRAQTREWYVLLERRTATSTKATLFPSREELALETEPQTIPGQSIDTIRKVLELRCAIDFLSVLRNGETVVLDGDLEAEHELERHAFDQLSTSAELAGVVVCGLSKTNRYVHWSGESMQSLLSRSAPTGPWYYHLNERTGFVKLHSRAQHLFRLDALQNGIEGTARLANVSADPVFLGYPYPLVEADARARVSFREVQRLRLLLTHKLGGIPDTLEVHDVLDAINGTSTARTITHE